MSMVILLIFVGGLDPGIKVQRERERERIISICAFSEYLLKITKKSYKLWLKILFIIEK
jgi:hypothetical protein